MIVKSGPRKINANTIVLNKSKRARNKNRKEPPKNIYDNSYDYPGPVSVNPQTNKHDQHDKGAKKRDEEAIRQTDRKKKKIRITIYNKSNQTNSVEK